MKVNYRGFEIDAHREKCMAGYPLLYFYVMRKSDGFFVEDAFTEGSDTVRDYIGYMKDRVDGFIADPKEEVLESNWDTDEDYEAKIAEHRAENEKTERQFGLPMSKRAMKARAKAVL